MENKQRIDEGCSYSLSIRQIRLQEQTGRMENCNEEPGMVDWIQQKMAEWKEKNQRMEGTKRPLNSASIGCLSRRMMTTEWARALGRELPDTRTFALEREAKLWEEMKQEEEKRAQREIKMLDMFCQLLCSEGKLTGFTENGKRNFDGAELTVTKATKGWNIRVEVLKLSNYLRRSGWGDLLGVYKVKLDKDLNIIAYSREIPAEASISR